MAIKPSPAASSHLVFCALLEAVLKLGVQTITFIDSLQLSSPLPPELDVCLVQVAAKPANMKHIPQFTQFPAPQGRTVSTMSSVVGKSAGGFVSSRGGAVEATIHGNQHLGCLHCRLAGLNFF